MKGKFPVVVATSRKFKREETEKGRGHTHAHTLVVE